MKGIVIVSRFMTNLFSIGKARGVTIFPFIFLCDAVDRRDEALINHENIHIRQAIELLVIPFYVWYFFEFFIRYLQLHDWNQAYHSISFEREAYKNEGNLDYLKSRRFFGFTKYI